MADIYDVLLSSSPHPEVERIRKAEHVIALKELEREYALKIAEYQELQELVRYRIRRRILELQ